jgi:hypothetical protein
MGVDLTSRSAPAAARWRYAGCSVVGTSHLRTNTPCQDFCAIHDIALGRGIEAMIAVAADGAGSAARSEVGAREACLTFLEFAKLALCRVGTAIDVLGDGFASEALYDVRQSLEQMARDAGEPLSSFACTLLGAIVTDHDAYFLQVGDGAIVFRMRGPGGNAPWRLALQPQRGEFVNETMFVTRTDAERQLTLSRVEGEIAEFALMTDGVEQLAIKLAGAEPHAAFFEHAFRGLRAAPAPGQCHEHKAWMDAFLASPLVSARTDDDKTLVLCTRQPG